MLIYCEEKSRSFHLTVGRIWFALSTFTPLAVISLSSCQHYYSGVQSGRLYGIPRIVWQTYKTHDLPLFLRLQRSRNIALNPKWKFILWNDSEIDAFIAELFPQQTQQSFDSIHPDLGVMRADLWRYCILHVYGGVYLDIDSTLKFPLDQWLDTTGPLVLSFDPIMDPTLGFPTPCFPCCMPCSTQHGMVPFFYERFRFSCADNSFASEANHWIGLPNVVFQQWMLISPPRHPFMKNAIDMVQSTIACWIDDEEAAKHPMALRVWWITGPMAWTRGVSVALAEDPQIPFRLVGRYLEGNAIQIPHRSHYNISPGDHPVRRRLSHYSKLPPDHPIRRRVVSDATQSSAYTKMCAPKSCGDVSLPSRNTPLPFGTRPYVSEFL